LAAENLDSQSSEHLAICIHQKGDVRVDFKKLASVPEACKWC
jgi:hypothetical protein